MIETRSQEETKKLVDRYRRLSPKLHGEGAGLRLRRSKEFEDAWEKAASLALDARQLPDSRLFELQPTAVRCRASGMLLLHLSDIHFRVPHCQNPDQDEDRPVRTRLVADVRTHTSRLGQVDAILIGGDVAFAAHPDEYAAAQAWLEELATACGCIYPGRLFVIPGNHDVDRAKCRSASVLNAQRAIKQVQGRDRLRELRRQLSDRSTAQALFEPLAAYNEFAKHYNCQVYGDRLSWKQDLQLGSGVTLRLHGLTSTLVSGFDGQNDDRQQYVSPLQTAINPVSNVVNLALCHHPITWLEDARAVDDDLRNRAMVQLFGHEHSPRIVRDPQFVRFEAGAVHPDRDETGWRPAYNLIRIEVQGVGANRRIEFDAHSREWQANPERFRPALDIDGSNTFRHSIVWPEETTWTHVCQQSANASTPAAGSGAAAAVLNEVIELPNAGASAVSSDSEASMGEVSTRGLVFRFWKLTVAQRREIADKLGLLQTGELELPEFERYERVLRRAKEHGLLADVAREVDQAGRVG